VPGAGVALAVLRQNLAIAQDFKLGYASGNWIRLCPGRRLRYSWKRHIARGKAAYAEGTDDGQLAPACTPTRRGLQALRRGDIAHTPTWSWRSPHSQASRARNPRGGPP